MSGLEEYYPMFGNIDSLVVGAVVEIADQDLALLRFDTRFYCSCLEGHFVIESIIIVWFLHIT